MTKTAVRLLVFLAITHYQQVQVASNHSSDSSLNRSWGLALRLMHATSVQQLSKDSCFVSVYRFLVVLWVIVFTVIDMLCRKHWRGICCQMQGKWCMS